MANPRAHDESLGLTREQVASPAGTIAIVKQDGTTVAVFASRACDVREVEEVRRTTTSERVNRSPALDWTLGALGVGLAATGTVVLVDASSVYPHDASSRQYNPVGPTGARVLGASLAAAGLALGAVAVVDVVRAGGEETTTDEVQVPGRVVEHAVACEGRPLVGAPVVIALPKEREPLQVGVTAAEGKLAFDLDSVVPKDRAFKTNARAEVLIGGERAGSVELARLYAMRDEAAWAPINLSSCETPDSSTACLPVERYLERYSEGAHAVEARTFLAKVGPALADLRDDELWSRTNSKACREGKPTDLELQCDIVPADADASCETMNVYGSHDGRGSLFDCCRIKDGTPLDEFRLACNAVRDYAKAFPQGRHSADAALALKAGDVALKKWRDGREKARRKEIDQERREEAARARRERAEQAAAERKQQVDEARASQKSKACVARKCDAMCKMKFPYSDRGYEGCLELCNGSDAFNYECGVTQ